MIRWRRPVPSNSIILERNKQRQFFYAPIGNKIVFLHEEIAGIRFAMRFARTFGETRSAGQISFALLRSLFYGAQYQNKKASTAAWRQFIPCRQSQQTELNTFLNNISIDHLLFIY